MESLYYYWKAVLIITDGLNYKYNKSVKSYRKKSVSDSVAVSQSIIF